MFEIIQLGVSDSLGILPLTLLCFSNSLQFCFQFNRQGTHRTLDKELVVALLKMVLTGRIPDDRLETFCTFVETQNSYTRITLDQWTSFLDFCLAVPDLSQYDESSSAWPVLIDEYVEYMEEQQKKK
jgi:Cullin binding